MVAKLGEGKDFMVPLQPQQQQIALGPLIQPNRLTYWHTSPAEKDKFLGVDHVSKHKGGGRAQGVQFLVFPHYAPTIWHSDQTLYGLQYRGGESFCVVHTNHNNSWGRPDGSEYLIPRDIAPAFQGHASFLTWIILGDVNFIMNDEVTEANCKAIGTNSE